MMSPPPLVLFLLILILPASKAGDVEISSESLPFIQRVPCSEPQGRCSFKDFADLRSEKKLLQEWMVVLYFDFEKYSSHDLMADLLPGVLHVKLFRHKILVGRVLCNSTSMRTAANAALCQDMDPSVVYAFQYGRKTEYWWSVSDFTLHRAFVIGNLLTLQYKNNMESVNGRSEEEVRRVWKEEHGSRKYILVVQLVTAGMEVNALDRVRAFDFVGIVVRTIPGVRILVDNGHIKKGLQFWWYDNRLCRDLDDIDCEIQRFELEDFENKDADLLLCELEQFSAGIFTHHPTIDLRSQSAASRWEESNYRLLLACPFVFVRSEAGESVEDLYKLTGNVDPQIQFMTVVGDQRIALMTLISHGADLELASAKVLIKFHSESINQTNTDIFSQMTTAAGLQVQIQTYNGSMTTQAVSTQITKVFGEVHHLSDYANWSDEYNPYRETDELFLIHSSYKRLSSESFAEMNETEFNRRTASGQEPAVVLFYMPWNSASLVTRDIIFTSASKELKTQFNRTQRLYSVDCFNWNELCQRQGIDRYPTVKIFVDGAQRQLDTVVSLAEILRETVMLDLGPVLEPKTAAEVEAALNLSAKLMDHAVLAVGIEDKKVLQEFQRTAAAFKGKALFVILRHEDLPQDLRTKIRRASIASFSSRLRPTLIAKEAPMEAKLAEFVIESRFDRVMELTWKLFHEFETTQRPLLVLLVLEMTPKLECLLASIAAQRRGQFHVTWLHAAPNSNFPIFKGVTKPTLVMRKAGSLHRLIVAEDAVDSPSCSRISSQLDQWLSDVRDGKTPASEFVNERAYPPRGLHINCVDDVYPRPSSEDSKSSESSSSDDEDKSAITSPVPTEVEETEADSTPAAAAVPISAAVNSGREEL